MSFLQRRFKLLLVVGVLLLVGLIAFCVPSRSSRFENFVCGICGAERDLIVKRYGGFIVSEEESVKETEISKRLSETVIFQCSHQWHRIRFGYSQKGGLFKKYLIADGFYPTWAHWLLRDVKLAENFITLSNPKETWKEILAVHDSNPEELDSVLTSYLADFIENGGPEFKEFWEANREATLALKR